MIRAGVLALSFAVAAVPTRGDGPGWSAISLRAYKLLRIDGRTDLLVMADHKLRRLDGRTGLALAAWPVAVLVSVRLAGRRRKALWPRAAGTGRPDPSEGEVLGAG
jgi:hypothetical protein